MTLPLTSNPSRRIELGHQTKLFVIARGITDEEFERLVSQLKEALGNCLYALGTKFNFHDVVEEELSVFSRPSGLAIEVVLRFLQQLDIVPLPEDQTNGERDPLPPVKTKDDVSELLSNWLLNDGTKVIKAFRRSLRERQLAPNSTP